MRKRPLFVLAGGVVVLAMALAAHSLDRWADPGAGYETPDLGPLAPGEVRWGNKGYIEYLVGDLPLILSAPHGGTLSPHEIPNRTRGYGIGDAHTEELTRLVADALRDLTGRPPHMVISRLARRKLDPNREPVEAANGDPIAEQAWLEYHGFIDVAKQQVTESWGAGLYLDIHGHGHRTPWIELGYLLVTKVLNSSDRKLDNPWIRSRMSLRALAASTSAPLSELVRGSTSLGAMLERRGYRTVPSPGDPGPGRADYFNGGYSTLRHGSYHDGTVSSIQLEHPTRGVLDTEDNRQRYARQLAGILVEYMEIHYGFTLSRAGTPNAGTRVR
ncbi:MAG: N-formylglutamate amidohydrolase [Thermoanaerobaculia bacterium]|nr:N-formylglutamate amidohydrolase [Thermoanaerobaculia bacterium]